MKQEKKGDVLQTVKTDEDERVDFSEMSHELKGLPASLVARILSAQREFQEQDTPEAKFALGIDKLEPSFQLYFGGIDRVLNVPEEFLPEGSWHGFVQDARREATKPYKTMHQVGNFLECRIRERLDQTTHFRPAAE